MDSGARTAPESSMPRWLTPHASLVLLCAGCVLATSAKGALRPGSVFRDCAVVCPEMVLVPPGRYRPNAFGLYDMEGNAFEWVEDCWADNYQGAPADGSARTAGADCANRVNRGGSWTSMPSGLRSAHRGLDNFENTRVVDLGFRVVRNL